MEKIRGLKFLIIKLTIEITDIKMSTGEVVMNEKRIFATIFESSRNSF